MTESNGKSGKSGKGGKGGTDTPPAEPTAAAEEPKPAKGGTKAPRTETPKRALVAALSLPKGLEEYRETFAAALNGPELGYWPEGETYVDAKGHAPEKIARALLRTLHLALPSNLRLGVVWRDGLTVRGAHAFAAISKAGGRLAFFTDLQAVLEVDWDLWKALRAEQRLALIDHELHHLVWDTEKERLGLVGHDVEEFGGIIRRWGLWRPSLVQFAKASSEQLDLLPEYLVESITAAEQNGNGKHPPEEQPKATAEEVRDRLRKARGKPAPPTAGSKKGGKPVGTQKALRDRAVEPERPDDWTDPAPPKPDLEDIGSLRAAAEAGPDGAK